MTLIFFSYRDICSRACKTFIKTIILEVKIHLFEKLETKQKHVIISWKKIKHHKYWFAIVIVTNVHVLAHLFTFRHTCNVNSNIE